MKRLLYLVPCIIFSLSFQDGRNRTDLKLLASQIDYLEGQQFTKKGITGKGIRIAILDGGFPGVNTHPAFRHLIEGKQIAATWNFIEDKENVFTGVAHGTEVLSCLAGIWEGRQMGLAPDAQYLLAITEKKGEPLQEEKNWADGVDWAIAHGARIIQSSLGYTYQRYFTTDMDGNHSIAAKAAARAARKGILIINCVGNEGQSKWKTLVTPADADSIISVGAIDPKSGLAAAYSSIGPTADKRLKPNVCAPGHVVVANPHGGTRATFGTSFSSPLIAGFAACAWEMYPTLSAQQILSMVEKAGHLYPYYDYAHGYGIPQASRIINPAFKDGSESMVLHANGKTITVLIPETVRPKPEALPGNYLYYHISGPAGLLKRYGVFRLEGESRVDINITDMQPGDIFRCRFNQQGAEWTESK